jgi:hypothetical protein
MRLFPAASGIRPLRTIVGRVADEPSRLRIAEAKREGRISDIGGDLRRAFADDGPAR